MCSLRSVGLVALVAVLGEVGMLRNGTERLSSAELTAELDLAADEDLRDAPSSRPSGLRQPAPPSPDCPLSSDPVLTTDRLADAAREFESQVLSDPARTQELADALYEQAREDCASSADYWRSRYSQSGEPAFRRLADELEPLAQAERSPERRLAHARRLARLHAR